MVTWAPVPVPPVSEVNLSWFSVPRRLKSRAPHPVGALRPSLCPFMRLRWPTRATIRERCKLILATATSSTRCDTPSCRRAGSRISGAPARSTMRAKPAVVNGDPRSLDDRIRLARPSVLAARLFVGAVIAQSCWLLPSARPSRSSSSVAQNNANSDAASCSPRISQVSAP